MPVTHEITTKYREGIQHDHRIRWVRNGRTRFFNIRSLINLDEANRFLIIMAEENVPT
jgi:head-tail adaptor